MSAALVRKALDETALSSEEKLDHLSKAAKKKFKPLKKQKKLSQEKLLKQNLKLLQALEYKSSSKSSKSSTTGNIIREQGSTLTPTPGAVVNRVSKKSKSKKKTQVPQSESGFTEEDFEKFEKEYFVS